jgi:serine phosphatase RsbU (regulator of sigma subunit)
VEKVGGDRYRLRNDIYRRFLTQHFNPGRVGRLFTAAGRWDSAIKHLEASAGPGSEQYRWDLLTAIINSMYASEDVNRAAHFLLRGLAAAFGIQEAQVWWAPIEVTNLRLAAQMGAPSDLAFGAEVPIREDRLEARAYRDKASLRGPETPPASPPQAGGERGGWRVERALPLLATRQQPVGVVVLQDELGERIAEQRERDLQLLSYLNQAARALEQVGRRTQELALAGRIQATLLPATPTLPGWELAATLRPARLTSGDFYDFLRLPGGKLGIAVADVADKGMGAALYMALSRTLIRTYAADYPDQPQHVMDATSSRMLADAGAELFVTAFYGVLDPISGRLTYSNAGHHPPYVIDAAGGAAPGRPQGATPLQRTGMALGVQSGETWQQQTVQLVPGDLLVLYTDGVCDAENGERDRFGPERLLEVLSGQAGKPAQEVLAALLAALHDFAGSEAQSDDITIVVVKRGAAVTAEELGVPRETVLRWRPRQTV